MPKGSIVAISRQKQCMYEWHYIIDFMQGKQVGNPASQAHSLDGEYMDQYINQSLVLDIDQLVGLVGEVADNQANVAVRGKGRPKGEKNSKDRERKTKAVLCEENRRHGHWSTEENKRYHWFLEIYNRHFICKEMRRLDKIFKTMAVFIGSREAEQCRSHHQKMQKKYHTFANIISFLRRHHYGTEDTKPMTEDMRHNQVNSYDDLLSPLQLILLDSSIKQVPPTPTLPEEAKVDYGEEPNREILQFQQNSVDLLGEDYEHKFCFDSCLL